MLSCLGRKVCFNADIDGLQSAGGDCSRLAGETSKLCERARIKGEAVSGLSQDIRDILQGFGEKIDASSFLKIKELVEDDKTKETMTLATDMDDMAKDCITKSKEMSAAMSRGVQSLPDPVKTEFEQETDREDSEVSELLDIDKDIKELETCTKSIRSMNVFDAARSGASACEGLANKGHLCGTIFDKIKDLAGTVARISEALMGGSCCAQIKAIATEAKDMFKCIHPSGLITKAAEAVRRLIKAMITLIKTSWDKFQGFMEEFGAAKRIGRFVNSISPVKSNSETTASGFMGKLMSGQCQ